jgi:hypothetical protein
MTPLRPSSACNSGVGARFIPIRADLLSGVGLSIMALVLALGY